MNNLLRIPITCHLSIPTRVWYRLCSNFGTQRVVLKVDGPEIGGQPIYYIEDKNRKRRVESLKTVDKNNIESISGLKGEGATKLYGEEGKNGVVLIYLKKNK